MWKPQNNRTNEKAHRSWLVWRSTFCRPSRRFSFSGKFVRESEDIAGIGSLEKLFGKLQITSGFYGIY